MSAVLFVLFAVAGTIARALFTSGPEPGAVPWRTLAVNSIGAGLLGLVLGAGWWADSAAVGVAGLGSLTTFSTVAGEAAALLDDGRKRPAILYVGLTVVVGVTAAWIGLEIGARL